MVPWGFGHVCPAGPGRQRLWNSRCLVKPEWTMNVAKLSDEQLFDLAVRATIHIQRVGMRIDANECPANAQLRMELSISGDVLCQVEEERQRRIGARPIR